MKHFFILFKNFLDHHDITEILLKVALTPSNKQNKTKQYFFG